jgi:hypothetical protein
LLRTRCAPVNVAAAAWLLGTLAVHQLPALPPLMASVPALLAVLLVLRHRPLEPLLWCIAAIVWTAWCAQLRLDERLPAAVLGRDVEIAGWVDGFPAPAPGQATFSFRVAPPVPGVPSRLRLTWYKPPADLAAGVALTLTARSGRRARIPAASTTSSGSSTIRRHGLRAPGSRGSTEWRRGCVFAPLAGGSPRRLRTRTRPRC